MGRHKKVYSQDVLDSLKENGVSTVYDLAKNFECATGTIRNRIKELREDGIPVLPTRDGVMLVEIIDENNANTVLKSGNWLIGEVIGMTKIGKVAKRPLIQVRKILKLTKDERNDLRKMLMYITKLIDTADIDEDLELIQQ